jgi:hypothetical protein
MHAFQVEPEYVPPSPQLDLIADNCRLARRVLAVYMGEACDIEVDDDGSDVPDLMYEGDGNGLVIHDTEPVPISAQYQVSLSNVPLIRDLGGGYIPFTHSGYVSLRAEDREQPAQSGVPTYDEGRDQIIFHLPRPGHNPAEIFRGYSLESSAQILPHKTRQLHRIKHVLEVVEAGLQHKTEAFANEHDALYHANAPRSLDESTLTDEELQAFFH